MSDFKMLSPINQKASSPWNQLQSRKISFMNKLMNMGILLARKIQIKNKLCLGYGIIITQKITRIINMMLIYA